MSMTQHPKYRKYGQNLNLGRDPQKNFYERHDYESVDEKSLSKAVLRKRTKKRIWAY